MKLLKWGFSILAGMAILVYAALVFIGQPKIEQSMNRVVAHDPFQVGRAARDLHNRLVIADLHCDSTLWARDLARKSTYGHVDIPRLQAGNVALQMFTAVTKSPRGQNYEENTDSFDNITILSLAQLWPPSTWNSLTARAVYQAEKLHGVAARVPEQFRVVTTAGELARALAERNKTQGKAGPVIGLLGIEGLHSLEGEIGNIATLYDAGYRMMGLHHFFDNKTGGSLHGISRAGLTEFGKSVVRELDRRSVIIDLAHSSPKVVEDILELSTRPQVVSHTGVSGHYKSPRNISDDLMQRIAEKGGLIGIGYWKGAVGDISPENIVRSIAYAVDLVGEDHVCLGSDFDGSTTVAFDTSELAVITREMMRRGFSEERIEKIMGKNTVDFLLANLPG
ncbi:MAG: dipeptidase [Desulfobacterales bacterium]|nr:dipeptidase [Desulfobacterales bacterium]